MIWINFKTYERGTGDKSLELALLCESISQESGVDISVCPQFPDIYRLGQKVNIEIWAQHLDPIAYGQNTGWVLPEALVAAGASGTLINHAEHRLPFEKIVTCIKRAQAVGLKTMVCTDNLEEIKKIEEYEVDYIAFEDPDLIGGDLSMAFAEPEKTRQAVEQVEKSVIVVGAGVKTPQDVRKSLQLGAGGVLVSSAIMRKTADPKGAILEVVEGFKS